jgi:hypothetical protein
LWNTPCCLQSLKITHRLISKHPTVDHRLKKLSSFVEPSVPSPSSLFDPILSQSIASHNLILLFLKVVLTIYF